MPIYEYECQKCKKIHEIWQKMSDPSITKCPDCKGKVERLISASGFALKGSGWYKTDYQTGPNKAKNEAAARADSASPAAESTASKGDTAKGEKSAKADGAAKAEAPAAPKSEPLKQLPNPKDGTNHSKKKK